MVWRNDKITERWNVHVEELSSKTYVDIKMAIRSFNCPLVESRDLSQINKDLCLSYFKNSEGGIKKSISGRHIRKEMKKTISPDELPALKGWSRILDKVNLDWTQILEKFFQKLDE